MRAAIHSSKYIKTLLVLVFSFIFSSAALVSNSLAIDLTQDVSVVVSDFRSQISTSRWAAGSCSTSPSSGVWVDQLSCVGSLTIYDMRISIPNRTYNSGDYIVIELINSFSNNSQSLHSVWFGASYGGYNPVSLISQEFENMDTNNGLVRLIFRVDSSFSDSNLTLAGTNGSWGILTINSGSNGTTDAVLRPATTTVFHSVSYNTQGIIDAINSHDYTQNLNSINNNINSVNNNLNDLQDTQEQANEDANDRYQDEKDTISSNGDDAQDSADSLDISFGVPWILQAWFSLFVDDSCASIPTISSWIHSNETRICSPWPSAVRSTLTPIFAVISGLLLFGFVIRWLRGGMFNNSIEVG